MRGDIPSTCVARASVGCSGPGANSASSAMAMLAGIGRTGAGSAISRPEVLEHGIAGIEYSAPNPLKGNGMAVEAVPLQRAHASVEQMRKLL